MTEIVDAERPLTTDPVTSERDRLAELEDVIERGLRTIRRTYREVGIALGEIRDGRAYRATYPSFEVYCRRRWGIGRNYADKLIRAAAFADETGTAVPTERAARALMAGTVALSSDESKPVRDVAEEALRALGHGSGAPRQGVSHSIEEATSRRRALAREERRKYHESFGDPLGVTFHAEKAARQLRMACARGETLTDAQADRIAALLREAAEVLDAVQRSEAPAE